MTLWRSWVRFGLFVASLVPTVAVHAAAIDLNRASVDEFREGLGVGPVPAERIVTHRETVGRFRSVDDLRDVWGVSERIIRRMMPHVTVRP